MSARLRPRDRRSADRTDCHRLGRVGPLTIDGVDLGESGPVPEQAHLADFWLPQRGLFAIGGSFFAAYDPARHAQVASRRELGRATPREAA